MTDKESIVADLDTVRERVADALAGIDALRDQLMQDPDGVELSAEKLDYIGVTTEEQAGQIRKRRLALGMD